MGSLKEFPLKYRLYLRTYRWQRIDPVPWTPLEKPLKDCRLALVSSAGIVTADQDPFDNFTLAGDPGIREISSYVDVASLRETHRIDAFDHSGVRQDPNLAFPINRMRELVEAGIIGSLNHRYFSLMGSVTDPSKLTMDILPQIVPKLVEDQIDAALLIPV